MNANVVLREPYGTRRTRQSGSTHRTIHLLDLPVKPEDDYRGDTLPEDDYRGDIKPEDDRGRSEPEDDRKRNVRR